MVHNNEFLVVVSVQYINLTSWGNTHLIAYIPFYLDIYLTNYLLEMLETQVVVFVSLVTADLNSYSKFKFVLILSKFLLILTSYFKNVPHLLSSLGPWNHIWVSYHFLDDTGKLPLGDAGNTGGSIWVAGDGGP